MKTPRKTLLSSSSPSNPTSGSRPWIPIKEAFPHLLAFMAVVAIVVFFLRWHIKSSYEEEVLFWQVRLTGVADDQAQRVSDWLKERQGDAMVSSSRPSLRADLRDYNEKGRLPKSLSARQSFPLSTLDEIATWYSYAGVYILDRDAHVVMQSSHSIPLNPLFAASCRVVARAGVARDELAGDTPSRTLMGFIAPVFPEHTSAGPGQSAGQPLGSVLLVSDASQALFPMVTREIIPSRTGESVLVRRDGDEVVYFSPLRHISAGSPSPRFPLSTAPVPAKYALENRQTYAEYNDYRGAPVLAATQGIPRTRWGLVRKIDRAEALKDFHHGALLECLAGAILILLLGSLLLILRRYIVARERERTGQELRRLNRALRTISGCNQVLVRAEKEPDLLSQVCETLVRLGGYRMAWVGFAEHDEAKSVRPVGQAGFEDGYLQAANITWADTERGQGPTGRAIRSGSVQVARDLLLDPSLAPWREEARKRGYASSITLPLVMDGEVQGALMVYAEEADAFDSAEVALLTELADDLAYGIRTLRTRAEHRRAEEALHHEKVFTESIIDSLPDSFFIIDNTGRYVRWNKNAGKALGYSAEEFAVLDPLALVAEAERPLAASEIQEALTKGSASADFHLLAKDGRKIPYFMTATRALIGDKIYLIGIGVDITERKRAEAALTEERHLLHSLMDNLPDRIYFKDRESRFTRINKAHAEQFGLSDPAQAIGKTDFDYFPEERFRRAFNDEQEIIRTGRPIVDREGRVDWPDGHVSWFATTKMPLRDPNGNIIGTFGISHDITERKRAEEALRESEGKYRSLVSNIPDVVWTLDANLRFVFISKNIERVSGFSVDEVDHHGADLYLASLHPDDVFKVKDGLRALFAEGRPYDVECRIRRKNGEWIWIHDRAVSTYEKSGMRYADGLLSDITEHKRAEAEHVRLVTAIEQSAEAVVITNPAGNIEYVNPAFIRITGYSRGEVLGQNPRILRSGKHDLDFYQQLWETILKGKPWQGELTNRRKDGSLYTEQMTITPVRDEHGQVTHFIATKQDVTERLALEAHLHQTSKMEAVGRLAGGVAHDFNNLLTVINGYSEILIEELVTDAKAIDYLREISNAGERAASLTRQLLAFSRHQVLAPQVLDMNAVVSNLEKMLRRLIGEDIKLRTLLNPSLARVKADPGQIEQVIMNLAVNARDAMPTGGHLTFETRNVELDEDYAQNHPTVKPGPHVMLGVSDTGLGMTPETKARIFEPFFTTKEMGKGTGLGLATVYGIVKQSGGSIWVYSEVGRGTTFKIYFPIVSDSFAIKEPPKLEMDSASGTETVLVVEDDEAVRSLVRLALVSGGYKVLETPDAESALAICASHDGPIHLLLTDVVMPQMSGPEVVSKVAALRPGIRVLYMSGYTDDAVVHHGVLTQEMPFIQKPFSPVALRMKIREVLGGN